MFFKPRKQRKIPVKGSSRGRCTSGMVVGCDFKPEIFGYREILVWCLPKKLIDRGLIFFVFQCSKVPLPAFEQLKVFETWCQHQSPCRVSAGHERSQERRARLSAWANTSRLCAASRICTRRYIFCMFRPVDPTAYVMMQTMAFLGSS